MILKDNRLANAAQYTCGILCMLMLFGSGKGDRVRGRGKLLSMINCFISSSFFPSSSPSNPRVRTLIGRPENFSLSSSSWLRPSVSAECRSLLLLSRRPIIKSNWLWDFARGSQIESDLGLVHSSTGCCDSWFSESVLGEFRSAA